MQWKTRLPVATCLLKATLHPPSSSTRYLSSQLPFKSYLPSDEVIVQAKDDKNSELGSWVGEFQNNTLILNS